MKITKRKAKGVLADMISNMDEDSLARTREKMERISEDYCSKEVRNLLVTTGFVGDMWYNNDDIHISHALAMKWLREGKKLHIEISFNKYIDDSRITWTFTVLNLDQGFFDPISNEIEYSAYEEAVEAALKYALKNLI